MNLCLSVCKGLHFFVVCFTVLPPTGVDCTMWMSHDWEVSRPGCWQAVRPGDDHLTSLDLKVLNDGVAESATCSPAPFSFLLGYPDYNSQLPMHFGGAVELISCSCNACGSSINLLCNPPQSLSLCWRDGGELVEPNDGIILGS